MTLKYLVSRDFTKRILQCLILIFILILVSNKLKSQNENYQEFLVLQSNDTLFGDIRRVNDPLHDRNGFFIESNTIERKLIPTEEIIAYKNSKGEFYYKKSILRFGNPSFHFFQLLFKGKVSLYKYQSDFYLEKNKKLYKLKNTESNKKNKEGDVVVKYNKEYISTLNVLLSDCYGLYDKITSLNLTYKSLVHILKNYHECNNQKYKIFIDEKRLNPSLEIGTFIGLSTSWTSSRISTNRINELTGIRWNNIFFGVDLKYKLRSSSSYFILISPHYISNYTYSVETIATANKYWIYNYNLTFEFDQLDIPFGFGKEFSESKNVPYFGIGYTYTRFLNVSTNYLVRRKPKTGNIGEENIFENSTQKLEPNNSFGIWTVVGVNFSISDKFKVINRLRYQANNFYLNSGRIQGGDKTFNYHQLKFELGLLF
ncbi:hypothetical protein [Marivirga arenosa]|uniref:Outer membrane protein beta-barrel domain-containing protein n=1 Tax=Marivirga arenosa TaxID=3059076 RepID=A0AA51ZUV4_9BACT|nr:hypothetical protein [Marivirga sp. BKB1-2]WNB17128.1 hypothetical protein QYS47_33015 [Marivirga sp. BKB1-2]